MSKLCIADLQVGQDYEGELLVLGCEVKTASNGPYVQFELTDGSTNITAKRWRSEAFVPAGVVINLIGTAGEYNGKRDINIKRAKPTDEDPTSYLPHGPVAIDQILALLAHKVEEINNEELRDVARAAFNVYVQNKTMTAALGHHHAYLGGLLQHIFEVVTIAQNIATAMDTTVAAKVNHELIFVGALVHDIGKIRGYAIETNGALSMTDEGKLIDHIMSGSFMIREIYFDAEIQTRDYLLLLQHIIASHHGRLDWGSPVVPSCVEALIVSQADLLSSRIAMFESTTAQGDSEWTKKDYMLGTAIFKGVPNE